MYNKPSYLNKFLRILKTRSRNLTLSEYYEKQDTAIHGRNHDFLLGVVLAGSVGGGSKIFVNKIKEKK